MPWRKNPHLDAFFEASRNARTVRDLFALFIRTMNDFGFDLINFSVKRNPDIPPEYQGFGLISTYPQAWQDHYRQERLDRFDPVLYLASGKYPPFAWRNVGRYIDLARRQVRFLAEAEDAGMYNGIGIPLNGPSFQRAGVALATSSRAPISYNLDLLVAYCEHFYKQYKRLVGRTKPGQMRQVWLSDREQEVLACSVHHRSDPEIGLALGMSPETVDYHFRRIFAKLGVNNRGAAMVIAFKLGLFDF